MALALHLSVQCLSNIKKRALGLRSQIILTPDRRVIAATTWKIAASQPSSYSFSQQTAGGAGRSLKQIVDDNWRRKIKQPLYAIEAS